MSSIVLLFFQSAVDKSEVATGIRCAYLFAVLRRNRCFKATTTVFDSPPSLNRIVDCRAINER